MSLAYAQNHDEIDAAWNVFRKDRDDQLEALRGVARETATSAGLRLLSPGWKEGEGWIDEYVDGMYRTARQKLHSKARYSGWSIGFDSWPDGFAFYTLAFFELKGRMLKGTQLMSAPADLTSTLGVAPGVIRYFNEDGSAFVRLSLIRPTDETFSWEAFRTEAVELPKRFKAVDAWLADRLTKQAADDDD